MSPLVQSLFERMSDQFHGTLEIVLVYQDGSAKVRATLGNAVSVRRISAVHAVVDGRELHLVKVEHAKGRRDQFPVFVSMRPSSVLAMMGL